MVDFTILTVTSDAKLLRTLKHELRALGGSQIIWAETIKEACEWLAIARARLIVMHWNHSESTYEEIDQLLWANTVLARPAPVLVLADQYQTNQALMLFRMGVTEYISRSHHLDDMGRVLRALLERQHTYTPETETPSLPTARPALDPVSTSSSRLAASSV